jgi:hypothetical protein
MLPITQSYEALVDERRDRRLIARAWSHRTGAAECRLPPSPRPGVTRKRAKNLVIRVPHFAEPSQPHPFALSRRAKIKQSAHGVFPLENETQAAPGFPEWCYAAKIEILIRAQNHIDHRRGRVTRATAARPAALSKREKQRSKDIIMQHF